MREQTDRHTEIRSEKVRETGRGDRDERQGKGQMRRDREMDTERQ